MLKSEESTLYRSENFIVHQLCIANAPIMYLINNKDVCVSIDFQKNEIFFTEINNLESQIKLTDAFYADLNLYLDFDANGKILESSEEKFKLAYDKIIKLIIFN